MANKCIILYADEFRADVWEQYCKICGESPDAISLQIAFNDYEVEAEYLEEVDEDDEEDADELVHYRCTNCDFCFDEHEITGMWEDGRDACPACGSPLDDDDIDYVG